MFSGKCSWFGGPNDDGVDADEGLAFIYSVDMAPTLFLPEQPPGTTGLARRLNPQRKYVACRWDYENGVTSKEQLLDMRVIVAAPSTGRAFIARPADWGPHEDTGRAVDVSPALLEALGIETDDEVRVYLPGEFRQLGEAPPAARGSIVISSGHGKYIRGAADILDEVNEARRVVEELAKQLRAMGVTVTTFHDDTSTTQDTNLKTIVDFHNKQKRDLDVSVHFNAYEHTDKPMGTECLYVSQQELAARIADAVAEASGLPDRGGKYRGDLYVLNNCDEPTVLIETVFVDSRADAQAYDATFAAICRAIATVLANAPAVA